MDTEPDGSLLKKIEQHAKRIHPSLLENNGGDHLAKQTIKIKEEDTSDEIKEYAATTMSELLGWYGYDKVDSGCTRSLNLDHFASVPSTRNNQILRIDQKFTTNRQASRSPALATVNGTNWPFEFSSLPLSCSRNLSIKRPSSPVSLKKVLLDSTSNFPHKNCRSSTCSDNVIACSWCGRLTQACNSRRTNSLSYNTVNTFDHFCSEACFVAGRRAVFKRAKTCDWCRHIRNPVNYVDFQDGESQLQFCSDRCLNQYKMNIFCHETQTHLMLHGLNNVSLHEAEKSSLITPELWFRNCQSPSNNSTDNTFVDDEHLTLNVASPVYDKREREEQGTVEKSVESSRRVRKKKDSFCNKKCTNPNNYNDKKRTNCTEIDKSGINECTKEETFVNEENEFYHFINNENHCRINCSEKNMYDCKTYEMNYNLMNVGNHDSYNPKQNDAPFVEKSVHVKNVINLREERKQEPSDKVLKSTPGILNTNTLSMERTILLSPKSVTGQSCQRKQMPSLTLPMQFNQNKSSTHSIPTAVLPPVTIFIPYPIPVPVPIPIPVPIPTTLLSKMMAEQDSSKNAEDRKYKNIKQKDFTENKCSVSDETQLNLKTNTVISEPTECAISAKPILPSSTVSSTDNDNTHSLKYKVKSLRKRKRSNESSRCNNKRRNKFIAA